MRKLSEAIGGRYLDKRYFKSARVLRDLGLKFPILIDDLVSTSLEPFDISDIIFTSGTMEMIQEDMRILNKLEAPDNPEYQEWLNYYRQPWTGLPSSSAFWDVLLSCLTVVGDQLPDVIEVWNPYGVIKVTPEERMNFAIKDSGLIPSLNYHFSTDNPRAYYFLSDTEISILEKHIPVVYKFITENPNFYFCRVPDSMRDDITGSTAWKILLKLKSFTKELTEAVDAVMYLGGAR